MRTIVSETNRFPDPASNFPALIVKSWAKGRVKELEAKESLTDGERLTLSRLKDVSENQALMEPPVLIDTKTVKVCILSRSVGTLWLDEIVPKISFDDFLDLAFEGAVPKSTLWRDEPYTLEEIEAVVKSEVSAKIPGYIKVVDGSGKVQTVIIGDVLDETTVDKEKLVGKYTFESSVTEVYGYTGDPRPVYPFTKLEDMCIAITTIKDTLLLDDVVLYSIPLTALRALITEHDTPPKIVSVDESTGETVTEVDSPSNYLVGTATKLTFDKAPKATDLVVKSLVDTFGNKLAEDEFTVRMLSTANPLVMKLEVGLVGYQRRFFAEDEASRKNSFVLTVTTQKAKKNADIKIPLNWDLPDNTFTAEATIPVDGSVDIKKLPITLSLIARSTKQAVADLTPLYLGEDPQLVFNNESGMAPTVLDNKYVLAEINGKPTITFNTSVEEFGPVQLPFFDQRIMPSVFFVVDPAEEYEVTAIEGSYDQKDKKVDVNFYLLSPYSGSQAGLGTVVEEFKNVVMKVNGVAVETTVEPNTHMGSIAGSFVGVADVDPVNIKVEITGTFIVGRNKLSVDFTNELVLNEQEETIQSSSYEGDGVTSKKGDGSTAIGDGLKVTTALKTTTADKIVLTSLTDAKGADILDKGKLVVTKVEGSDNEFIGHVELASSYAFPFAFKDADGYSGIIAAEIGVDGVENSSSKVDIPYKVSNANGSIRAWVVSATTATQDAKAKDSVILEVGFLDGEGKAIKDAADADFDETYPLFAGSAITYLGGGIKFSTNSDGRYTAKMKVKFSDYGDFMLNFKDPMFKGDMSSLADPTGVYAFQEVSATVNAEAKNIFIVQSLKKDGKDFTIRVLETKPGEPRATIDGTENMFPGSAGWNYTKLPSLFSLTYYGTHGKTIVEYQIKDGVAYLGANKVPVKFSISGTAYTPNGGPAETTPGVSDGNGGVIADGGTTTNDKPVFGGKDMKPGSTVTLTDNGEALGTATVGEDGTWSYTPDPALENGKHVINIKGTDKNDMPVDQTTTINVAVPTAETKPGMVDKDGNAVEDGGTTTDNKPTFSGKDMKPGSTVTIKDGDKELGTAVVDEDGNWSYTPDEALDNGEHTLTVEGTDKNGKPVKEETTVVVDAPSDNGGEDNGGGESGGGEMTAEEKALSDPTEGGKYAGFGDKGMGVLTEGRAVGTTTAKIANILNANIFMIGYPPLEVVTDMGEVSKS